MLTGSEKFSIELQGRANLKYIDNINKFEVMVGGEMLTGESGYVVYKDYIKLLKGNITLTDQLKDEIVRNIKEAFRFQGFEIEVD